jgi:hypothetical protein
LPWRLQVAIFKKSEDFFYSFFVLPLDLLDPDSPLSYKKTLCHKHCNNCDYADSATEHTITKKQLYCNLNYFFPSNWNTLPFKCFILQYTALYIENSFITVFQVRVFSLREIGSHGEADFA